ncbi:UvrD-helicase domain-containing protein [Cryobacterium sp. TMS1-20-1]|uniref:UvrD-helicase domain-containing protein n=1 Tax=Cryobacterium sp. TMS1-20-1 TaxID=1259223 RepID=UPI00141AC336|nr:ATP-dependent helicase [Cryobacterium sp. TMS1-20-1]
MSDREPGKSAPFTPRLSKEQTEALIGGSNLFLKACPGSGKTRTVAARVAAELSNDKTLAMLSYTNVGAREVAAAVVIDHSVVLKVEDFVGTVHAFLNKFVLHPFGHLVTRSDVSMSIDPDEAQARMPVGVKSAMFEFRMDGTIRHTKDKYVSDAQRMAITKAKRKAGREGYVNYSDSIFVCRLVLSRYPAIAEALAKRFDEIIVDEAQDTSAMQLECLRLIARAGLKSLVLVGDYDQTIYEFIGSSPGGCDGLATELGLKTVALSENYRSSQLICDMTARIRGGGPADRATGEHASLQVAPKLLLYKEGGERQLVEQFESIIVAAGIAAESKAILIRTGAAASKIKGTAIRTPLDSPFKEFIDVGATELVTFEQYKSLERVLVKRSFGRNHGLSLDRSLVRSHVAEFVDDLPELEGDLFTWLAEASRSLDAHAQALSPATTTPVSTVEPPESSKGVTADLWVVPENPAIGVDTIHSAKGLSIDAVMLVGMPRMYQWPTDAENWAAGIDAVVGFRPNEALRVGYVALTRARQLNVLALPSDTDEGLIARYESAGFERTKF